MLLFQLYVLGDVVDMAPQFCFTQLLFSEVMPKYVITMGSTSDMFVRALINLRTDDESTNSNEKKSLPSDMALLDFKEYSELSAVLNIEFS